MKIHPRKNKFCVKGHLVSGKNAFIRKSGYIECRICRYRINHKPKPEDLSRPISESREDNLRELSYIPNGDFTYYYNLGHGNRRINKLSS